MTPLKRSVKLYANRISADLQPVLDDAKAYNLKHGIDITFTLQPIDVTGYKSSEFRTIRPGVNFCILDGSETLFPIDENQDVSAFVFDQNEWKTPPGSHFPLLPDTPTSDVILVNGKPYMNLGVYTPMLNQTALKHELMHCWEKESALAGFPFTGVMDVMYVNGEPKEYYLNDQPDNVNSNFIRTWELLYPWLNSLGVFSLEAVISNKNMDISKWGLMPELESLAAKFLAECEARGYPLRITQGLRTEAQQAALYAQGRTAPGPIVTNANVGQSYHETGKAFDVCFEGLVAYPNDDAHWKAIADIGQSLGLTAGYYFSSFQDKPHFQI